MSLGRQLQVLDLVENGGNAQHNLARFDGRLWALLRQANRGDIPATFADLSHKVKHENVATALAGGKSPEGFPYVVEEYAHGLSLYEMLKTRKSIGPMEAARMIRGAALGFGRVLDACRGAQTALPESVPLRRIQVHFDGKVKVTDPFEHLRGKTDPLLQYLAPEVLAAEQPSSDAAFVFGLGLALWELCAGRALISAQTRVDAQAQLQKALAQGLPRLVEEVPGFPSKLDDIIEAACAQNPEERFATVEAFANALSGVSEKTQAEVASCMQSVFVDAFSEQRSWLARAHEGLAVAPVVPSIPAVSGETSTLPFVRESTSSLESTQPLKPIPKHMLPRPVIDGRYRGVSDSSAEALKPAYVGAPKTPEPEHVLSPSMDLSDEAPTRPFQRALPEDKTDEMPTLVFEEAPSTTPGSEQIEGRLHAPASSLRPAPEPDAKVIVDVPPNAGDEQGEESDRARSKPPLPMHATPEAPVKPPRSIDPSETTVQVRHLSKPRVQKQDVLLVVITLAFLLFAAYTVFVSKDDAPTPRPSTVGVQYAYPTNVPPLASASVVEVSAAPVTRGGAGASADPSAVSATPATATGGAKPSTSTTASAHPHTTASAASASATASARPGAPDDGL